MRVGWAPGENVVASGLVATDEALATIEDNGTAVGFVDRRVKVTFVAGGGGGAVDVTAVDEPVRVEVLELVVGGVWRASCQMFWATTKAGANTSQEQNLMVNVAQRNWGWPKLDALLISTYQSTKDASKNKIMDKPNRGQYKSTKRTTMSKFRPWAFSILAFRGQSLQLRRRHHRHHRHPNPVLPRQHCPRKNQSLRGRFHCLLSGQPTIRRVLDQTRLQQGRTQYLRGVQLMLKEVEETARFSNIIIIAGFPRVQLCKVFIISLPINRCFL